MNIIGTCSTVLKYALLVWSMAWNKIDALIRLLKFCVSFRTLNFLSDILNLSIKNETSIYARKYLLVYREKDLNSLL